MILAEAYHYVRFRWWTRYNLEMLSKELSVEFDVKKLDMPNWELDLSLLKDERDTYVVKSDTLTVFLAPSKAVLSQRKRGPLTLKDQELRRRVMEKYPAIARSEPQFETI